MTVRAVEGKKPYTGGKAIEITEDKVINLRLRAENNLIIYDEGDDEIYVDLQLPDGIEPLDTFPVGITTGRVLVDDDWDVNGTIVCFKTTSGDNIKLLYGDDGKLYIDNGTGLFKQIYLKGEVDALLQALRDYVDGQLALKQDKLIAGENIAIAADGKTISAMIPPLARFLSIWDCETGLPDSFPSATLPFEYITGDHYIVGTVDTTNTPPVNYRPDGIEFDGTASTVVESADVQPGDVYIYDGSQWLLQVNHDKVVTFAQIAGQPSDNTNLATALNAKQDELTEGFGIDIDANNNNEISVDTYALLGNGLNQGTGGVLDVDTSGLSGTGLQDNNGQFEVDIPTVAYALAGSGLEKDGNDQLSVDYPTVSQALAGSGLSVDSYDALEIDQAAAAQMLAGDGLGVSQFDTLEVDIPTVSNHLAGTGLQVDQYNALEVDSSIVQLKLVEGANINIDQNDTISVDYSWTTITISSGNATLSNTRCKLVPTGNFTLKAPSTVSEGQEYVLRCENTTVYTMTLGTGFTNPHSVDLTLSANATDQFIFLATPSGDLELQPAQLGAGTGISISNGAINNTGVLSVNGQTGNVVLSTTTFQAFPNTFNTSGTTAQFLSSIANLNLPVGSAYLGQVSLSDMPTGVSVQGDVEVYIYPQNVVYAVMRSAEVPPYIWVVDSYSNSLYSRGWTAESNLYTGPSAPTSSAVEGMLWYDTVNDKLKTYDGTNWNETGVAYSAGTGISLNNNTIINTLPGVIVSSTAPSSPTQGTYWYYTTDDTLFYYDGSSWNHADNVKTFRLQSLSDSTTLQTISNWIIYGAVQNCIAVINYNMEEYYLSSWISTIEHIGATTYMVYHFYFRSVQNFATTSGGTTTIYQKQLDVYYRTPGDIYTCTATNETITTITEGITNDTTGTTTTVSKLWAGTAAELALITKDANTLYISF